MKSYFYKQHMRWWHALVTWRTYSFIHVIVTHNLTVNRNKMLSCSAYTSKLSTLCRRLMELASPVVANFFSLIFRMVSKMWKWTAELTFIDDSMQIMGFVRCRKEFILDIQLNLHVIIALVMIVLSDASFTISWWIGFLPGLVKYNYYTSYIFMR